MFQFIPTAIIATSMAICSYGAAAGSDVPEKSRETMRRETLANPNNPQNMSKEESHKYDSKAGPISDKDRETMRRETMGKPDMGENKSMSVGKEKMSK